MGEEKSDLSPLNYMRAQIKKLETLLDTSLSLLKNKEDIIILSEKIFSLCQETLSYLEKILPAPQLACAMGCGHCCHNLIEINPFWSFIALDYMQTHCSQEQKKIIIEHLSKKDEYCCCPFLFENKCAIYRVRPPVCRGYYSLELLECFKENYCEKNLIPPSGYRGEEVHSAYQYMIFLYILEQRLKDYEEKFKLQSAPLFLHKAVENIFHRKDAAQKWLKGELVF